MSDAERERIDYQMPPKGEFCPKLKDGCCTVYDRRPLICRLWGIDEAMPCEHGCVPQGGHIPQMQSMKLLKAALVIGGGKYDL